MIKAKPYQNREHRNGNHKLQSATLPNAPRQQYTERDLEMLRKGFIAGRLGQENLEQFEKKLTTNTPKLYHGDR